MLTSEHVYTHAGWQRAVVIPDGVRMVRFVASGVAAVEVCYDRAASIRRGQAVWVPFAGVLLDGHAAGHEPGISGIRVRVDAGGEGRLRLQHLSLSAEDDASACGCGCAGADG